MNIIEPSKTEKDKAIEDILSMGLSKPKCLWKYLSDMYTALGLRYIFFDMAFSILMTIFVTSGFTLLYLFTLEQHRYTGLFAIAPIIFISHILFSETIEQVNGMYELKMTCRYTVQQIAAFRILSFSLFGTVFCTFISLHSSQFLIDDTFFKMLSLSLCALFLCAFLTIFLMRHIQWRWIHVYSILLWIGIDSLLICLLGKDWELFLSQMPIIITMSIATISCILFLVEIKKLINTHKREVAYYVSY